jgi:spastin
MFISNRDQDDLKDMQFSISRTLEMIHTRTELLLQFINDPKHRRISIPRTTTTNIPKRKPIDSTRLPVIKGVDSTLVSRIMDEVVDSTAGRIVWDDISGLEAQKALLRETVVLPFQRPDIFVGVRAPARGILMFGPPGTGKTLMAKAVAGIAHCTFFALSASSITSKWIGESEKLIRALFACARHFEPAIIFIDEIDSLLQARNDSEHEAMRRVKTEFLLQFDGMNSSSTDRIVVIGATNRPADLDEAARRRFTKRILIPLPDATARNSLLQKLLKSVACDLKPREFDTLVHKTEGFSAADISALASDIALHPIRDLDASSILTKASNAIRPITWSDVQKSLQTVKSSVDPKSIKACQEWNSQFGSC